MAKIKTVKKKKAKKTVAIPVPQPYIWQDDKLLNERLDGVHGLFMNNAKTVNCAIDSIVDDIDNFCDYYKQKFGTEIIYQHITFEGDGSHKPTKTTFYEKPMVVHCKKQSFDVYIGRNPKRSKPNKWGNPFIPVDKSPQARLDCIAKYENNARNNPEFLAALHELKGKVLGCWCAPKPCHGDVLVKLIKEMVR